jgi:anti-anti-sigma factor
MTRHFARGQPSRRKAGGIRAIDEEGRNRRERIAPMHATPLRAHRLELTGQLGHESAAALEAAIDELCAGGVQRLVLDLSRLTAIDSVGVDVVRMRCRLCGRRGVAVELVGGPPQVMAAFEAAGLGGHLPFRQPLDAELPVAARSRRA